MKNQDLVQNAPNWTIVRSEGVVLNKSNEFIVLNTANTFGLIGQYQFESNERFTAYKAITWSSHVYSKKFKSSTFWQDFSHLIEAL